MTTRYLVGPLWLCIALAGCGGSSSSTNASSTPQATEPSSGVHANSALATSVSGYPAASASQSPAQALTNVTPTQQKSISASVITTAIAGSL